MGVVPVGAGVRSATNGRRTCRPGTASWVTPATPSSALGTSTPCQCRVTPSGTPVDRVTSTRSPCCARIVGPGDVPFSGVAVDLLPGGQPEALLAAVRVTLTSGVPAAGPVSGSATLARLRWWRPSRRGRVRLRPAAAVVGVAHVHDGVRRGHQAGVPEPSRAVARIARRRHDGDRRQAPAARGAQTAAASGVRRGSATTGADPAGGHLGDADEDEGVDAVQRPEGRERRTRGSRARPARRRPASMKPAQLARRPEPSRRRRR